MRLKLGDICVGLAILLLAALLFVGMLPGSRGGLTAVITVDGQELRTVSLEATPSYTIELPGELEVIVAVERGRIRFVHSNCPDQTCVHTGWLDRAGMAAACLPGRALIRLEGADGPDVVIG